MKAITKVAVDKDYQAFLHIVMWFGVYNIIYFILKYITRHWGWPTYHPIRRAIHKKYVSWFFTLDNNYVERIGTGHMIGMLEKSIAVWAELMVGIVNNIGYHGTMILFFCYVLASIHIILIPILLVVIIGMLSLLSYFNKWTTEMRANKIIE
jgi:ABC-type multidrug transport system fused ATPase/permease subunit